MSTVRSERVSIAATTAALGAVLAVAVPMPATADAGPSASPSAASSPEGPAPSADPEAMQAATDALAADRARIDEAEITTEMAADATFVLDAAGSTFALDAADATTTLERTEERAEDTVVTLTSDLLFDFGEATLTPEAEAAVVEMAAEIPQDATVRVDGYTDSVGGDALNQRLSQQRAQAVADVLGAARGDLTLEVAGHGEDDPVAENMVGGEDNPAGRALNRRVEVTYPTS